MKIIFPNITENDFNDAINCLESCKQNHAKEFGFNYPYFTPGGMYGKQWWQLDSSLALSGYKWIDRAFCERALLNFVESQKPDGRICLWGADLLPKRVAGGNSLAQTENVSSLPKLFDVAYFILQGCKDLHLKLKVYNTLKRYLDWWFYNRQDNSTGLITAVFEETFIPYLGSAGEYASVDTNVEIYVGCAHLENLALELGFESDATLFNKRKNLLKESINKYLWNEEKGAYFPYYVKEGRLGDVLMASCFYPLRMQIATKERQKKLLSLLTNHEFFNWNTIPLTSVCKKDDAFVTTLGDYVGNDSWSGNVWTLINEMVIRGLIDCEQNQLASELAIKTLYAFKNNLAEFINPFDGKGHGVIRYAWTASQFIEIFIEIILGISFNAVENTVKIKPCLPKNMLKEKIEFNGINIDSTFTLNVKIDNGKIEYSISDDKIKVSIS